MIQDIDRKLLQIEGNTEVLFQECGRGEDECCKKPFDLQLIEVLYLYSNINRHFTSAQREILIQRSVAVSKFVTSSKSADKLCPFNDGSGCEIYDIRPARCRIYGKKDFLPDKDEINSMLFELSKSVFFAFSGKFLSDVDFIFPVADIVSGKFVQKYFNYMAEIERKHSRRTSPEISGMNS